MTRNKSIFLVGIFFVISGIFGNIFWRMFFHEKGDALGKIRRETAMNLASKGNSAVPASAATGATTKTASSEEVASPGEAQSPAQAGTDSLAKEDDESFNPTSRKTNEDTIDWKTYADEKNIFELKYPADAQVNYNGDIFRVSQNKKTWKFRIFSNKDKSDLQTWYAGEFSEKERTNCTLSDSTLRVASYEMKYVNPGSGEAACGKAGYFSISTDKKYVVRVELGDETVENVNKILATFKFKE